MMFIDSHSHLSSTEFDIDRNSIIKNLKANHISKIVVIGCSIKEAKKTLILAKQFKQIYPVIGLYPFNTKEDSKTNNFTKLKTLTSKHPEIVGIGECGLDYTTPTPWEIPRTKENQQILFEKQIQLAKRIKKPIVIHSRKSKNDTINILKKHYNKGDTRSGVWHCYSEDIATAKEAISLGFYISFSGLLTYPKMTDLMDVAKHLPLEKILIETDAPYLIPHKQRQLKVKRNEPKYVKMIGVKIAELKGISTEKVAIETVRNTETLFKI